MLNREMEEWTQKNSRNPVPRELLARNPCSRFHSLRLSRHGMIPIFHRDLQICLYDADSHYPGYVIHRTSNQK